MNVLIVSCVFPPDIVTSAETSAQLADGLAKAGHQVTVIAPAPTRNGRPPRDERDPRGGVRVVRAYSRPSLRFNLFSKLLENVAFGLSSFWRALRLKPDILYANTWPLFAAGLMGLYAAIRKVPMVVSVQDIHPESAIRHFPGGGWVLGSLRLLDRWIALRSSALVTISNRFADFYKTVRRIPPSKVHVVPNWMDEKVVREGDRLGALRRRRGIPDETFLAMYVGSIGAVADWATVLSAAARLREVPGIRFLLAGGGSQREMCEEAARGLQNVSFVYPLRSEEFNDVQAAADLLLLPTRPGGALTSVPSKLIAYLLAGRPVLAAVDPDSDTATFVKEARCGACVPPGDSGALADAIVAFSRDKAAAEELGRNGRRYAEEHFSKAVCVPRLVGLLEFAARPTSTPRDRSVVAPDPPPYSLRPMSAEHVRETVALHVRSFPEFFLTFLGPRFLWLFYDELLRDPGHVAYVALDASKSVAGFAVGVTRPAGFYRRLILHRLPFFLLTSLPAAMKRPAIIPRLIRALRTPARSGKLSGEALLMSIAVRPDQQSQGLGRRLLDRFLRRLQGLGVESVCLTTDRENNERGNRFYASGGFSEANAYQTPEGRWMTEYVRAFKKGEG